jgi:hypothetical protein
MEIALNHESHVHDDTEDPNVMNTSSASGFKEIPFSSSPDTAPNGKHAQLSKNHQLAVVVIDNSNLGNNVQVDGKNKVIAREAHLSDVSEQKETDVAIKKPDQKEPEKVSLSAQGRKDERDRSLQAKESASNVKGKKHDGTDKSTTSKRSSRLQAIRESSFASVIQSKWR